MSPLVKVLRVEIIPGPPVPDHARDRFPFERFAGTRVEYLACGHVNRQAEYTRTAGSRRCWQCGAPHIAVCPACGGLEADFLDRAPDGVCSICNTNWTAINRPVAVI